MKVKTFISIIASAVLAVGSYFSLKTTQERETYSFFDTNLEVLAQSEQPNVAYCIYNPDLICVALHPTNPEFDMERPYAMWW